MSRAEQYWLIGILAILLGAACFFQLHFFYPWFFSIDDAYIVLHSAQALRLGYDPNYLGTPPLAGNTSPIYLFLIFLLCDVLPPLYAAITASWLSIFLYAFALVALAQVCKASLLETLLVLIIGLLSGNTVFQLFDGVETGLMLASMCWALVLALLPSTKTYRTLFALLLGALPFIRPELILFSLALFLYQWKRDQGRHLGETIFFMAVAALPWLLWIWYALGTLYPSSAWVKRSFFAIHYTSIFAHLDVFLFCLRIFFAHTGIFLIPLVGLLCFSLLGEYLLGFSVILLLIYYFNATNLLMTNENRYLFLLLPILIYAALSNVNHAQTSIRRLAKIGLVFSALQACLCFPWHWKIYRHEAQSLGVAFSDYTTWSMKNIPRKETIAIQDAGYIAFATPFHLIDFVGLKTPSSIVFHEKMTSPSEGTRRVEAISQILQQNHIHYLIVTQDWDEGANISKGLRQLGWRIQLLHRAEYPSESNGYLIYKIEFFS